VNWSWALLDWNQIINVAPCICTPNFEKLTITADQCVTGTCLTGVHNSIQVSLSYTFLDIMITVTNVFE
jgi:hypothetical protein